MADLQTSSYASKAKASPVLDVKPVQRTTRDPYEGAGDVAFAEKKVWDSLQGFTHEVLAKAAFQIDDQADQAAADDFVDDIRSKFVQNARYIEEELSKLPSSQIKPEKVLQDFENGKIEGFGYDNPEEMEGYEELGYKYQKQVKDQFRLAKEETGEAIMKKMAKLSSQHTMRRLNKQSLESQTEIQDILNDKENIVVAVEAKDYVKAWGKNRTSRGGGMSRYESFMRYELSQGRLGNLGGQLKTEAKPEDIGTEGGITDHAKKRIDGILNRFSDRAFDALSRNVITMKDVEDMHNTLMGGVLKQHFLSQNRVDPHTAIKKAEKGEYRYKKDFTGYSGEEQVDYILDPDFTYGYIEKYHVQMSKPPKADPMAVFSLQQQIYEAALNKKPLSSDQVIYDAQNNPGLKGDPIAISQLAAMALKLNIKETEAIAVLDQADIIRSIGTDIENNPDKIDKYFNEVNGKWVLKHPEDLAKVVPDLVEVSRQLEWKYGDGGYEWRADPEPKVTKGANRRGVTLLRDTDFANIITKYNTSQRKIMSDNYIGAQINRVTLSEKGARNFLEEWTDPDYPGQLDRETIERKYHDPNNVEGQMLAVTYTTWEKAQAELQKVIKAANAKLKDKPVNKKWVEGTGENLKAFWSALKEKHTIDIAHMKNVSQNVNPADIDQTTMDYNPIAMLEARMIEETDKGFNDDQLKYLDFYNTAQEKLQNIQSDLYIHNFNEIEAYIVELKGVAKNRGRSVKYFMNGELATLIESQLSLRKKVLSDATTATEAIYSEMGQGTYWIDEFPLMDTPEDEREWKRAQLIAERLKIPVELADTSIDSSGITNATAPPGAARKTQAQLLEDVEKAQSSVNSRMHMQYNHHRESE